MVSLVDDQRDGVEMLCRKHRVKRLEVFGSAADGTFDPARSDIDFLVEFQRLEPGEHADSYFGLLEDLKELFGRKVDLVEAGAMRNPYFIRRVNESRRPIYDA